MYWGYGPSTLTPEFFRVSSFHVARLVLRQIQNSAPFFAYLLLAWYSQMWPDPWMLHLGHFLGLTGSAANTHNRIVGGTCTFKMPKKNMQDIFSFGATGATHHKTPIF